LSEKKPIELVKEPEIIAPASIEKTLEALRRFEEFKRRVLNEDDYAVIKGKKFVKKSGWLKYALACSLSLEKRDEREEIRDDGTRVYHYTYRAIAPSGRFADAVGSASSDERDFAHEIHDVRALAQTRAMERAISNLVGGGELGAEELLPAKEAEVEEKPEPTRVAEVEAAKTEPAKFKPPEAKVPEKLKWEVVWEVDNRRNPPLAKKKDPYTILSNTLSDLKALRGVKFQSEEDDSYLFALRCSDIPEDEKGLFLGAVAYTVRRLFDIPDSERHRVKVYLKEV